jgi:hypothetical protein
MLGVVGCGGGIANQSDPAAGAKTALDGIQSGGLAKIADFACAAKQGDVANLFGGQGVESLTALGMDPNEVFNAVKVEFKDVKTEEKSRSGDTAVVHISGTMAVNVDPAKMRDILKKVMEANGQSADNATLDAAMTAMGSQLSQTQTIDEDVTMAQEGGKWLICS